MRLIGNKSITFKLTLLFASASTAVLLLLGVLIGSLVERHFEDLDMELLGGKLELLRHTVEKVRSSQELKALPTQFQDSLIGHPGLAVVVLTSDGQALYPAEDAKLPEELLAVARQKNPRPILWADPENHRYRGIAAELPTHLEGAASVVVGVSTDLSHHEHFMHSFRTALWTAMGLAALITGFLGWIAARQGLAPLRDISRSAARITANRLDQRLSADSIPVELAEVALTLNEMLARLEQSFRRLTDFSSDIAHELRTPVSNLLTQTQVTLSKTRSLDEYRDILASNVEEFERLSRVIADMLFLAKSDNNLLVPHREKVDLVAEVKSLFDFYEALVEEKDVRLICSGRGVVFGDRLMLRRAVSNLLSNAVRHTSEGGKIEVRVDNSRGSTVVLSVKNTGETIAPEHLSRLFDRFYRVHGSRERFGEGAGLGLAITRSIAQAHGGEALVHSEDGSTTFEIRLPVNADL